ncbi:MAG: PEP/pyruvate-binding domain-containing protein [Chloroflexi bacterium]|nr:PEP/pyruvate-binding domain-containing protein [Chloroflexota bacterium]
MNIVFFDEPGADSSTLYGGKAASLGKLASSSRVPPGFSLSVHTYRQWANSGAKEMPADLSSEIRKAYLTLSQRSGVADVPVAVRSSAVDEDGSGESFAGLHDTFLNVVGEDAVTDAVIKCWQSLKNAHALDYRAAKGLDAESALMGVVVQQLVFADVSAVVFSANPVSGDRTEVVINANYGLGEAVVSGLATPDTIIVKKADLSQQTLSIGAKEHMTVRTATGTADANVPRVMRGEPALTREQVTEMAQLAIDLEARNGWPVDVECAIQGSQLFLLQCRPITTLRQ